MALIDDPAIIFRFHWIL